MTRVALAFLQVAWTLLLASAAEPVAAARLLSAQEARELALEALEPGARRLPGLDFEIYEDTRVPNYFLVSVTWGEPRSEKGGSVQHLAIDKVTADVWSGVVCEEKTSKSLRKLQREMRRRLGVTDADYKKQRRSGPMC
jgi:hypothetical protein